MKIKLKSIAQELSPQQAKDIYEELKELFELRTNYQPIQLPDIPWVKPYEYDPMRVTYGPVTTSGYSHEVKYED